MTTAACDMCNLFVPSARTTKLPAEMTIEHVLTLGLLLSLCGMVTSLSRVALVTNSLRVAAPRTPNDAEHRAWTRGGAILAMAHYFLQRVFGIKFKGHICIGHAIEPKGLTGTERLALIVFLPMPPTTGFLDTGRMTTAVGPVRMLLVCVARPSPPRRIWSVVLGVVVINGFMDSLALMLVVTLGAITLSPMEEGPCRGRVGASPTRCVLDWLRNHRLTLLERLLPARGRALQMVLLDALTSTWTTPPTIADADLGTDEGWTFQRYRMFLCGPRPPSLGSRVHATAGRAAAAPLRPPRLVRPACALPRVWRPRLTWTRRTTQACSLRARLLAGHPRADDDWSLLDLTLMLMGALPRWRPAATLGTTSCRTGCASRHGSTSPTLATAKRSLREKNPADLRLGLPRTGFADAIPRPPATRADRRDVILLDLCCLLALPVHQVPRLLHRPPRGVRAPPQFEGVGPRLGLRPPAVTSSIPLLLRLPQFEGGLNRLGRAALASSTVTPTSWRPPSGDTPTSSPANAPVPRPPRRLRRLLPPIALRPSAAGSLRVPARSALPSLLPPPTAAAPPRRAIASTPRWRMLRRERPNTPFSALMPLEAG